MTTISTIKKLAASTAIAGSLGVAALSLGTAIAAADTGSGSTSSSSASAAAGTSTTSGNSTSTPTAGEGGPYKSQTAETLPPSLKERIKGVQGQEGEQFDVRKLQESLGAAKDSDQRMSDFLQPFNEELKELSEGMRR
jgi:hypothetical protein